MVYIVGSGLFLAVVISKTCVCVCVCSPAVSVHRTPLVFCLIAGSHQAAVTRCRLISLYICCNKYPASFFPSLSVSVVFSLLV